MESLVLLIYAVGFVGVLSKVLAGIIALCAVGLVITVVVGCALNTDHRESEQEKSKFFFTSANRLAIVFATALFLQVVTPSKDTAQTMLAAYVGTEVLATEQAQELGDKTLQVIDKFMSNYLGEEKANEQL